MHTIHRTSKFRAQLTTSICALGLSLALLTDHFNPHASAKERAPSGAATPEPAKTAERTPEEVLRLGLEYLLGQQSKDGGWGQGGGWRKGHDRSDGRVEGAGVEDPADLGNTCVSLVAVLRAGKDRPEVVAKAFAFIAGLVEQADDASLYLTPVRDTQLQVKIGTYVDTFLAGWALSELQGRLDDPAAEKRRVAALDKVVSKIERNQQDDGSYAGNKGWAAVLSQGLASKALNAAARSGAKVSTAALDKDQKQNLVGLDVSKGEFSAPTAAAEPSSAGVSLYREAAKLGGLWSKTQSNLRRQEAAEKTLADAGAAPGEKEKARDEIKQIGNDKQAEQAARTAVAGKLGDSRYVAGFGNHGGEEFLSYLNLGESLHDRGGPEWETWKQAMQTTLSNAQNADGSWSGQHCITGRTFCTAGALLTLLIDRVRPRNGLAKDESGPASQVSAAAQP